VLKSFVVPKSFDRLIGLPGAVLTGLDTYAGGLKGYGGSTGSTMSPSGVHRRALPQPWTAGTLAPIEAGWNWTIENNEVSYNSQVALKSATDRSFEGTTSTTTDGSGSPAAW
jgi:hypothetical protein